MSIEGARATEDQLLEEDLASGDITVTEYNKSMMQLDQEQCEYERQDRFRSGWDR